MQLASLHTSSCEQVVGPRVCGHDCKLGGRPSPLAPTRKLVTLEQDLLVLIVGFTFPMVSVLLDGLTYGSAVTISPPEYWALFGFGHLG